jgi:hypothetical protein
MVSPLYDQFCTPAADCQMQQETHLLCAAPGIGVQVNCEGNPCTASQHLAEVVPTCNCGVANMLTVCIDD